MAKKQTHIRIICDNEETHDDIYNALEKFLSGMNPNWDVDMRFAEDSLGRISVKVTSKHNEE